MGVAKKIAIIGQGYVGLPLALAFAEYFPVIGFDIDSKRVDELNLGCDLTLEAPTALIQQMLAKDMQRGSGYQASASLTDIADAQIFIVTVPTPIDEFNAPDLSFLLTASQQIGSVLKKGDIVIYESTVYPGCTEEDCIPVLERVSHLVYNQDFFVGYSPERINPGDRNNTLQNVVKVTSGSNAVVAEEIDQLYAQIITAGTFKASSIKVAEAAKAIENAQRDVNISFVNELALIFDRVGIDTHEVLEAAGTKYNFLKYKPGLVGGHCISVDPYYLAHKASQLGYHPEVILSGRRVNDRMAEFVAAKVVKLMLNKEIPVKGAKVLILGMTFKENCPDIRNTKVMDIYHELAQYGADPFIYDPWVDAERVRQDFGIDVVANTEDMPLLETQLHLYDAVILAVAHTDFLTLDISALRKPLSVLFDCKAVLDRKMVDARL